MLHFKVQDFKDTNEFLSLLATRQGKLKKGGVPDINKAARAVLQEWTWWDTYIWYRLYVNVLPVYFHFENFLKSYNKEPLKQLFDINEC